MSMTTPSDVELSVVMPCLNEADTLETCIQRAFRGLREAGVRGEVVVADNGSTDGSLEIAERLGARVVHVPQRGYGHALIAGIAAGRRSVKSAGRPWASRLFRSRSTQEDLAAFEAGLARTGVRTLLLARNGRFSGAFSAAPGWVRTFSVEASGTTVDVYAAR